MEKKLSLPCCENLKGVLSLFENVVHEINICTDQ